jgi:serine O-acetyltransferase
MNRSLIAIAIYRFGNWCYFSGKRTVIKLPLKFIYLFLYKILVEFIFGLYVPAECQIGKGLYIGGFCGLVINPATKIGDHCTLGHGVVIGTAADGTPRAPILGNNVFIGAGAAVLGGIEIGDNVRIGANAVVVKSFPDAVTIAGVPAVIVSKISHDYAEKSLF